MQSFYWLDDNPQRLTAAQNMESAIGVEIQFCNLKDTNLERELATLVSKVQPTLIILDHNLEDANLGVFKKGSTAAAFIRESWPECPIVCITGEEVHNLNSQQKALYEEVFPISRISDYYATIKSIAISFSQAKEFRPTTLNELITLLKAPDIEIDKLISVLPTILKEDFNDNSLIVELSRWVRNVLIKRPGFLYNQLWLATFIGIKPESFIKIKHFFEEAKYNGLFAIDSEPLWWKSSALEILYDISSIHDLPWKMGRGITGIEPNDFSRCYVSEEEFPETVAFVDQSTATTEEQMKLKYSTLHPEYERLLHFEDIRLMKAQE